LKGVAGNIGAHAVQASAAALEHGIRGGHARADLEGMCAATDAALTAVLQAMAPVLQPTATVSNAPPVARETDAAQYLRACTELRALLASDDATALEHLARDGAWLQAACGEAFAPLQEAAAAFDFDRALALLDEAVARLPH
jgi:two-component system sensor histidine kinase/response regulator